MQVELNSLIDAVPGLSWSALPDGRAEFLNQRWLAFAGMTAEQAANWGWAEAIHPEDRQQLLDHWKGCLASGTPVDIEGRLRRHDGAYRWFLFRANPLRDEAGAIVKWYGTNVDIEDRRRAEEDLRARELSWRQIVDNVPGLVATTGALGEVEFLNRQTLEYFGKTSDELRDWSLIGAVHPDDLPRVIEAHRKSVETGQVYDIEHRCRRADGVYRWFQVRGLPVRDAAGAVTAWYLLLTDIEDRKRAEEALRSNEHRLSRIIDAIPACIQLLRADGTSLYVNQAVLDFTGATLQEVRSEGYRARYFHPEDVARLHEERRAALARGLPFETEQRMLRRDGVYRWFLFRYNPLLEEQGKVGHWYVAALDIEDRKRAEAQVEQAYLRLTEAQRLSKTGSFIADLLTRSLNWSEEAFRIFELDPGAKVTAQLVRDMVHREDRPLFDAMIARAMTGADVDVEFRITTSGGAVKHLHGLARLLAQRDTYPMLVGAIQDVTDEKRAEEALDSARSEIAHVARVTMLNTFTASIAHELNQPLAGILTNASTCLRMLDGDPPNVSGARETARRTIRDTNRARDVIVRLRGLFSKKDFSLEALDLNEIAREVIALSERYLLRNRVTVRAELADGLPHVVADRIQIQQVILNLLRNAADAMSTVHDRQRELLIETSRDDARLLRLTVKDVGVGIAPEARQRLFDAFYTTKIDGMGIGLSVSRSIIEKHHGRLWAEPNVGPGATFSFSIPCGPEDRPSWHEEPESVRGTTPGF
jgi:PAS domain S-box-containing protein